MYSRINPRSYQVRAGTLTYASGGTVHTIEEIIVHEQYRTINDIAVWRVAPAFKFDTNTAAAALPSQGTDTPAGTVMTVSGWGTTSVSIFPSINIISNFFFTHNILCISYIYFI
jgi:trypsin